MAKISETDPATAAVRMYRMYMAAHENFDPEKHGDHPSQAFKNWADIAATGGADEMQSEEGLIGADGLLSEVGKLINGNEPRVTTVRSTGGGGGEEEEEQHHAHGPHEEEEGGGGGGESEGGGGGGHGMDDPPDFPGKPPNPNRSPGRKLQAGQDGRFEISAMDGRPRFYKGNTVLVGDAAIEANAKQTNFARIDGMASQLKGYRRL